MFKRAVAWFMVLVVGVLATSCSSRTVPTPPDDAAPEAVARQLERDALDDALHRMADVHGPVDEDEVAAIMERLPA